MNLKPSKAQCLRVGLIGRESAVWLIYGEKLSLFELFLKSSTQNYCLLYELQNKRQSFWFLLNRFMTYLRTDLLKQGRKRPFLLDIIAQLSVFNL